jgi:hypothetical protein
MNDYFPILLIFGFVITFAIFVIFLFSRKEHIPRDPFLCAKFQDFDDQLMVFSELIEKLNRENEQLRAQTKLNAARKH